MTRVSWTHLQYQLKFEYFGFLIGSQISNILDALWNGFRLLATTLYDGRRDWNGFILLNKSYQFRHVTHFHTLQKTYCIYCCYYYSFSIPPNSLSNLNIHVVNISIMLKTSFMDKSNELSGFDNYMIAIFIIII